MRYLMLLRSEQPPGPPPAGLMEAIAALGEEATKAGVLLDTAGLHPSSSGARVSLRAGALSVTDGPFTESKEFVSYAIYEVRSLQEAIEWANRFLRAHRDLWPEWEGDVELRKVFGPEDFAPTA